MFVIESEKDHLLLGLDVTIHSDTPNKDYPDLAIVEINRDDVKKWESYADILFMQNLHKLTGFDFRTKWMNNQDGNDIDNIDSMSMNEDFDGGWVNIKSIFKDSVEITFSTLLNQDKIPCTTDKFFLADIKKMFNQP